ncbi:serine/arginine-rich splicing factor SR45-like [Vitis riparia]|uniref:serine/arginine-rich splicing factor SR45-like n=1 Tax=Vitis riparia TaxID=96939 RepID=UPI00155ADE60|nr:serine/arginine-rich splicing factor SR45-like [Vitis riparia]
MGSRHRGPHDAEVHLAPPASSSAADAPRADSPSLYAFSGNPHDHHSAHQTAATGRGIPTALLIQAQLGLARPIRSVDRPAPGMMQPRILHSLVPQLSAPPMTHPAASITWPPGQTLGYPGQVPPRLRMAQRLQCLLNSLLSPEEYRSPTSRFPHRSMGGRPLAPPSQMMRGPPPPPPRRSHCLHRRRPCQRPREPRDLPLQRPPRLSSRRR